MGEAPAVAGVETGGGGGEEPRRGERATEGMEEGEVVGGRDEDLASGSGHVWAMAADSGTAAGGDGAASGGGGGPRSRLGMGGVSG